MVNETGTLCDGEYKFEVISESVLVNLTVVKSKPLGS